jgi:hypothetical protein
MNMHADVTIEGSAGTGVAENMMSGRVHVKGFASNSAGASAHGGLLVIDGNAALRCGISLKGGDIVVGGSVGSFSAFMAQAGRMVVCGDAGDGLGDSLYEAVLYVKGSIKSLGADAHIEPGGDDRLLRLGQVHRERQAKAAAAIADGGAHFAADRLVRGFFGDSGAVHDADLRDLAAIAAARGIIAAPGQFIDHRRLIDRQLAQFVAAGNGRHHDLSLAQQFARVGGAERGHLDAPGGLSAALALVLSPVVPAAAARSAIRAAAGHALRQRGRRERHKDERKGQSMVPVHGAPFEKMEHWV